MAINVGWLVADRVLLIEFVGRIDLAEIQQASQMVEALLTLSPAERVHAIHDGQRLQSLPLMLGSIIRLCRQAYSNPQLGWVVAHDVGSPVLEMIGTVVANAYQVRYHITRSRSDALQFLQQKDATLPDLHLANTALHSPSIQE